MQGRDCDRGDHESEAGEPEYVLQRLESDSPDDQPEQCSDDRYPQEIVDVGCKLNAQRDAPDLGSDRREGDEERGNEVPRGDLWAEPLPNEIEDRATAHRRDTAGHLREDHDSYQRQCRGPRQRHVEACTDRGGGDEFADVNETANRGQDAQRDFDEPLHWCAVSKRCRRFPILAKGDSKVPMASRRP